MPTSSPGARILFWIVALVPLMVLVHQHLNQDRYAAEFATVVDLVHSSYVEDVQEQALFEHAMQGLTAHLDPYSAYFSPTSLQAVESLLDGEYAGVGMKVDKRSVDGPLIVLSPFFDTPAYRAGLRPGDVVVEVDGVSTLGMPRAEAVKRIRGIVGEEVRLRLHHAGEQRLIELSIRREPIVLPSLLGDARRPDRSWDFALQEEPRIAYLRLVTFSRHVVDELQAALASADSPPYAGIILDLRNNPGGHLQTAVQVCDLFIDDGLIVTTRDRGGFVQEQFTATRSLGIPTGVPMAILVNEYSASSSEIVAACLQDHQRAVVIGERTWGKGSVQTVFKLKRTGGGLKLTTATYWRPSGVTIHREQGADESQAWGVMPNEGFEVSQTDEELARLSELRRWRDVPRDENRQANTVMASATPADGSAANKPGPQAAVDRVRQRAIEYLRSQL